MIIITKVCVTSIAVIGQEILGPASGVMLSHTHTHTGNRPCDAPAPFLGVLQNVQKIRTYTSILN